MGNAHGHSADDDLFLSAAFAFSSGNNGSFSAFRSTVSSDVAAVDRVVRSRPVNDDRFPVEIWIRELVGRLAEVEDGEVVFPECLVDTGSASDNLLEFGHRIDDGVERDDFTSLGVHSGRKEFGSRGDDRIAFFRVDEIVELHFPFFVVAGNPHYVFRIFRHLVRVFVDEGLAHTFCVVDVYAEHDRFRIPVGRFQVVADLFRDHFGTFADDDVPIEIPEFVDLVRNFGSVIIELPLERPPSFVHVHSDADDFVRSKEPVLDPLFEGIGIYGVSEIRMGGNVFGFLRGRGKADLGGSVEIVENGPPLTVFLGASPVALVDDNEVEKSRGELFENVLVLFASGEALVEGEVDFVGGIDLAVLDLRHLVPERLEIVGNRLVDEDVPIGEEEDAFLLPGFPKAPDDLEGGIGFSRTRCHNEENAVFSLGDSFHGTVDGDLLVVARAFPAAVFIVGLHYGLFGFLVEPLGDAVPAVEVFGGGEFLHSELPFHLPGGFSPVVFEESVSVRGIHERDVERCRISEGLLHTVPDGMGIVLGFDYGDGEVPLVVEDVVGPFRFAAGNGLPLYLDAAFRKRNFSPDLRFLPGRSVQCRSDEFRADVGFGEAFLFHSLGKLRNPAKYRKKSAKRKARKPRLSLIFGRS